MFVFALLMFHASASPAALIEPSAPPIYINSTLPLGTIDGVSIQFPSDYIAARERFRTKAAKLKALFPAAEIGHYKVPSKVDKDLTTDFIFIPSSISKKLVIITSGIHGAEAFTGHTLQMWQMEKILSTHKPLPYKLLIVHSLNPYGFKYFRRTNENNVDLNRNFASAEEFKSENTEYEKLRYLLEPQYIASSYLFARIGFYAKAAYVNLTKGRRFVLGSLRGQYEYPKGIFYGGKEPQTETLQLQKLVKRFADNASDIYLVDLHTGFGEKGKLHFFGSENMQAPEKVDLMNMVFKDHKIETSQDKDFYATTGDFADWLTTAYSNKKIIPMSFEFGTMDSQTLSGGLKSLWTTVLENQGRHLGFLSPEDEKISRGDFEALFNPQSPEWQMKVLKSGSEALTTTFKNFETL
jgi:predicted deacylase